LCAKIGVICSVYVKLESRTEKKCQHYKKKHNSDDYWVKYPRKEIDFLERELKRLNTANSNEDSDSDDGVNAIGHRKIPDKKEVVKFGV
jgi:hypothetical protein